MNVETNIKGSEADILNTTEKRNAEIEENSISPTFKKGEGFNKSLNLVRFLIKDLTNKFDKIKEKRKLKPN